MIIIFLIILWLVIGYGSFVFWWTKKFNFTTEDILLAIPASLFGPLSFLIGFVIHGDKKIIIRKRGER